MKTTIGFDPQTPMDVVNILNSNYYDIAEDTELVPFSFSTDGYCDIIHFLEYPLWSSEADGYDYTEDGVGEPLPLIDTVGRLYKELHERLVSATYEKLFTK